jgi:hypothetical protein
MHIKTRGLAQHIQALLQNDHKFAQIEHDSLSRLGEQGDVMEKHSSRTSRTGEPSSERAGWYGVNAGRWTLSDDLADPTVRLGRQSRRETERSARLQHAAFRFEPTLTRCVGPGLEMALPRPYDYFVEPIRDVRLVDVGSQHIPVLVCVIDRFSRQILHTRLHWLHAGTIASNDCQALSLDDVALQPNRKRFDHGLKAAVRQPTRRSLRATAAMGYANSFAVYEEQHPEGLARTFRKPSSKSKWITLPRSSRCPISNHTDAMEAVCDDHLEHARRSQANHQQARIALDAFIQMRPLTTGRRKKQRATMPIGRL